MSTTINKLKTIVNLVLENKGLNLIENLTIETNLRDDLGLDSFDLAELTVRVEDEFGFDIFENGIVLTIGEILTIIDEPKK